MPNFLKINVLFIVGDNDWNDCKNPEQGLKYWKDEFLEFDKKYWKHDFSVIRQPNRMENFALIHKQSLFIGLNLVAGKVLDKTEWSTRFKEQLIWMKQLIRAHALRSDGFIGRVVLLGHTDVTAKHSGFFDPLRQFIQNELNNTVPILYINGDIHKWIYTDNFLDQPSSIRISLTGKAREPPLRVTVHSTGKSVQASKAFIHDRRLDIMTQIINFFQGIFG